MANGDAVCARLLGLIAFVVFASFLTPTTAADPFDLPIKAGPLSTLGRVGDPPSLDVSSDDHGAGELSEDLAEDPFSFGPLAEPLPEVVPEPAQPEEIALEEVVPEPAQPEEATLEEPAEADPQVEQAEQVLSDSMEDSAPTSPGPETDDPGPVVDLSSTGVAALPPPDDSNIGALIAVNVGLGALLVAATVGRRLLVGLWGFLFSHIVAEKVLAQPMRQRLVSYIKSHPGTSLPTILAELKMTRGNAGYHLSVLETLQFIRVANVGRHRHYFLAEHGADCLQIAILHNRRRRIVAQHILQNPGCSQSDISRALQLAPSRVFAHVQRLVAVGLVERSTEGRRVRLRPSRQLEACALTMPVESGGAASGSTPS